MPKTKKKSKGNKVPHAKKVLKEANTGSDIERIKIFSKCPICKKQPVFKEVKPVFFNLFKSKKIECKCGAKWNEERGEFILRLPYDHIYKGMFIDKTEWSKIAKGKKFELEEVADAIREGKFHKINWKVTVNGEPVNLKSYGVVYLTSQVGLWEYQSVRISGGGYEKILSMVENGMLVLTDKKLIYLGVNKSKNIDLKNIILVDDWDGNKILVNYGKQNPFIFSVECSDEREKVFITPEVWKLAVQLAVEENN